MIDSLMFINKKFYAEVRNGYRATYAVFMEILFCNKICFNLIKKDTAVFETHPEFKKNVI